MQCQAKSKRSGEQCLRNAAPGYKVCAMHGGKTPRGIASPHWKTGEHSRYQNLPERLMDRYQASINDPNLLVLRDEIAVVDARLNELMGKVDTEGGSGFVSKARSILDQFIEAQATGDIGKMKLYLQRLDEHIRQGSAEWAMWKEITDLFDTRRKLVESERKRLTDAQLMIRSDQAMALVAAMIAIVKDNVQDRATLNAISSGLARLTNYQVTEQQ